MADLLSLDRFDRPWCLALALVFALVWWMARRSLAGLGPIRGRITLLIRCAVVAMLVLVMAGTHRVLNNDDLTVLFLMDISRSVPNEKRAAAEEFMKKATRNMRAGDRAAILTFDGRTHIEQLPSRQGPDGAIHVPMPLGPGEDPDRTNIAHAIRMAAACAMDATNNRVVLLSDGNQNVGDAVTEARTAGANRIRVDVVPLVHQQGAEVVFEQLRAPAYANLHEQVPLRVILRSDTRTSGTIVLFQRRGDREEVVDLDPAGPAHAQRVVLERGRNAFTVRLPIRTARAHEFRAEFIPDDRSADVFRQNNVARAFTNVQGPQTVLFVGNERDRDDDELLIEALGRERINVQWETVPAVNLDTSVLQDYSAVVLSNVPADQLSAAQHQALANYVRDLGGGLIMIGGDDSFGAGGWQGSVVEDIMPVKFDIDAVRQFPRGALAIIMHSCEMPQGNKWGIEVAVAALKTLSSLDYFGVVGWGMAGYAWEVPMQTAANKDAITAQLRRMQNADMMDFDVPMRMAYQALMNCRDAAQRHMIVISDGDPSPPSSGLLSQMVGSKVTCSTVSIFPHGGSEIATLRNIAKVTRGQYYSISTPGDEQRLPRIFIKEARIVRRPLVRDETFTPVVKPHLSDIMTGIGTDFPRLHGYVVTTPRKVPDVEMPLVTHKGDPLLAHWLAGAGRTVAFTSGWWRRWGEQWPGWASFNKFWAQAVRWCMQQGVTGNFDVSTFLEGDEGRIVIESADEAGAARFRRFAAKVVAPDGTATTVPVVQTGPGRYEGRFKTGAQGTYLLSVTAPGENGKKPTLIRTGVTVAYSPEFRDLSTNEALLREIADETGGRVLSLDGDTEAVFAHNLPPAVSRKPVWEALFKLAIILFLADVAVRRVAIDPIRSAVAAAAYIRSMAGRWGAGARAQRTLADLKTVRERVQAERTVRGDAAALHEAGPPAEVGVGPDAGAKFEAPGAGRRAAKDLVEAMGGPPSPPPGTPPAQPKQEEKKEDVMSRLLRAKKRARDEQEGKGGEPS